MNLKKFSTFINESLTPDQNLEAFKKALSDKRIKLVDDNYSPLEIEYDIDPKTGGLRITGNLEILDTENHELEFNISSLTDNLKIVKTEINSTKGFPKKAGHVILKYPIFSEMGGELEKCSSLSISECSIRTLKGFPKEIVYDLEINGGLLKNLDNGPYFIGGSVKITNNPALKWDDIRAFEAMHTFIKTAYKTEYGTYPKDLMKDPEKYYWTVMTENPDWGKFLGDFSEFNYGMTKDLITGKDFGII